MATDIYDEFQILIDKISSALIFFCIHIMLEDKRSQQQQLHEILKSIIELEGMTLKIEINIRNKLINTGVLQCVRLKRTYRTNLNNIRDHIFSIFKEKILQSEQNESGFSFSHTIENVKDKLTLAKTGNYIFTFKDIEIIFCSVNFNIQSRLNKIPTNKKPLTNESELNDNITFKQLFKREADHDIIVGILVENNYIDSITHTWIDRKAGKKNLIIAILKDLKDKDYFKNSIGSTNNIYIKVARNTFKHAIRIDSAKKANPRSSAIPDFPKSSPTLL